jgi:hypothetical protein
VNAIIGSFTVNAIIDNDGHLTIWVASRDGSPVIDTGADIGNTSEFSVRLTTTDIERAGAK